MASCQLLRPQLKHEQAHLAQAVCGFCLHLEAHATPDFLAYYGAAMASSCNISAVDVKARSLQFVEGQLDSTVNAFTYCHDCSRLDSRSVGCVPAFLATCAGRATDR